MNTKPQPFFHVTFPDSLEIPFDAYLLIGALWLNGAHCVEGLPIDDEDDHGYEFLWVEGLIDEGDDGWFWLNSRGVNLARHCDAAKVYLEHAAEFGFEIRK